MKIPNYLILILMLFVVLTGCKDDWNTHYAQQDLLVNNANIHITNTSIESYLKTSEYKGISDLFEQTAVYESMNTQNLLYTVFIVSDEKLSPPVDLEERRFMAKAHVTTASISPSNMKNGQRIVMWNGKYVNIAVTQEGNSSSITLNQSRVKKVIKASNGYIYELEKVIPTPKSLLEVIESLNDQNYSIFKKMVLSRNIKEFNRAASLPVSVDASGNTIYDSVFTIRNPYFLERGMNLSSEGAAFTMLIPSNTLIENALSDAKAKLAQWGHTRQDSILEYWCFQSVFFKERLSREKFEDPAAIDLTSAFGKQWRTTVNKVDLNNPIEMSNGIAYFVTEFKIPQNVLIYRYKDYFKYYKDLTAQDKDTYFKLTNLRFTTTQTEVQPWTPGYGWPAIDNTNTRFDLVDKTILDGTIDFTAFNMKKNPDNSYVLTPYKLPPGEYTLHLGFGSSFLKSELDISFNGEMVRTITALQYSGFSRDRGAGGYPEFFPSSLSSTYDRDGGQVAVITVTGTEPVPVNIKIRAYRHTNTVTAPIHWAIRPTANNY